MLLVDDDVVYRMLSEKLLQVFGCMIDIAVDGAAAVSKMNLEKYDLVFMVCSYESPRKRGSNLLLVVSMHLSANCYIYISITM